MLSGLLDALHQPYAQLFLRLVLGGVLLLAGASKLAGRDAFRQAVAEYAVLPKRLERAFAALLPPVELALGALLLLGLGTTAAAALAAPLFLAFAAAIGVNLARGRRFDCHCFGSVQSDPIGAPALLRALVLALGALAVAGGTSRFGALEWAIFGTSTDLPSAANVIPVVLLAAVVIDVLVLLPETIAVQRAFSRFQALRSAHAHVHARSAR